MNYSTSDRELFRLFKLASEGSEEVRLLRIGGPLMFRRLVLSSLDAMEFQENKATNALLDQNIPSIRVLIADPDGVPFLTRLDYEKAGTWGIWRVRREILSFAKSLCALADLRQNPGELEIGFHQSELFWSLGIVGQTAVLVRAYGSGTGHDNSATSKWLKTGERTFLAESFINYWETISRRADTKWVKHSFFNDNTDEPKWPSLYKGNAVLSKEQDFDKESHGIIVPKHVRKICRHATNHEAEYAWVSITNEQRDSFQYFRPVKKAHLGRKVPPFINRLPVVMEKLTGFTLFEIANEISINKQSKEDQEKASMLLGEILLDSIKALREFRDRADSVISTDEKTTYQYRNQLINALNEVRSFIEPISKSIFDEAIKEVENLGKDLELYLEPNTSFPFRDAQLKNRIWVTKESISGMVERLLDRNSSAIRAEIKDKVRDIDFETSGFDVTEWDDVIHILFFEKSGILSFEEKGEGQLKPSVDPIKSYKDWWGKEVGDEEGFWMTVLARSIREFCRRLWYARTMPNTYNSRYEHERKDYFLDLALCALRRLHKYNKIWELLVNVKKSPDIWPSSIINVKSNNDKSKSEIVAFHPENFGNLLETNKEIKLFEYDVFICHSSNDKSVLTTLIEDFKKENITYWVDAEQIDYGDNIIQKIEEGLQKSRYVIPCLSKNLITSGWTREEYGAILHAEFSGNFKRIVIPLKLDNCKEDDIPFLLRSKKRVKYSDKTDFNDFIKFLKANSIVNKSKNLSFSL